MGNVCKFCGSHALIYDQTIVSPGGDKWKISKCSKCGKVSINV